MRSDPIRMFRSLMQTHIESTVGTIQRQTGELRDFFTGDNVIDDALRQRFEQFTAPERRENLPEPIRALNEFLEEPGTADALSFAVPGAQLAAISRARLGRIAKRPPDKRRTKLIDEKTTEMSGIYDSGDHTYYRGKWQDRDGNEIVAFIDKLDDNLKVKWMGRDPTQLGVDVWDSPQPGFSAMREIFADLLVKFPTAKRVDFGRASGMSQSGKWQRGHDIVP